MKSLLKFMTVSVVIIAAILPFYVTALCVTNGVSAYGCILAFLIFSLICGISIFHIIKSYNSTDE